MRIALYFIAIFSLSQSAALHRWAGAPPEIIGAWRLLLTTLILLPVAWRSEGLKNLWQSPKEHLPMIFASGTFFFAHLLTYARAAQTTSIAHCMILFATNPLWTALGASIFFRESLGWRFTISCLLAAAGLLTLLSPDLSFHEEWKSGDLSAVLSGVFFAAYVLTGKKARRSTGNSTYFFGISLAGGLLFALFSTSEGLSLTGWGDQAAIGIGLIILIPTLLGHNLFSWLMNFMPLNRMTLGKLLEPLLAVLTARLWFHEPISSQILLSLFLMVLALGILFSPWPILPYSFLHYPKNKGRNKNSNVE